MNNNVARGEDAYSAPTLAVAQRWLREIKGIAIDTTSYYSKKGIHFACTCVDWSIGLNMTTANCAIYEDALEAGIQKCLTIILDKQ